MNSADSRAPDELTREELVERVVCLEQRLKRELQGSIQEEEERATAYRFVIRSLEETLATALAERDEARSQRDAALKGRDEAHGQLLARTSERDEARKQEKKRTIERDESRDRLAGMHRQLVDFLKSGSAASDSGDGKHPSKAVQGHAYKEPRDGGGFGRVVGGFRRVMSFDRGKDQHQRASMQGASSPVEA
eukprot:CAMPEP_0174727360 /NCGR_PEP_ID=MMETSP1094-20130205/49623_1 /TAXON_ID=156173 /ORGANISM="Chrysochromulina brevifilum, Strain UTEX LB 985" /LENGTH=191 /DNA_ID=CAMNT_0015929085 /DNA_START=127 /DNA_END=699 /DNA_ORIENTATION=-